MKTTVLHQGQYIRHLRTIKSPLKWWVRILGTEHTYKFRTKNEAIAFVEQLAA